MKPKPVARALIGTDITGVPIILATDDWWLAEEVSNISTSAEEVGLVSLRDCSKPGLYLFTGHSELTYDWETGHPDGSDWVGEVRPVRPDEVAELYAMEPPLPPDIAEDPIKE